MIKQNRQLLKYLGDKARDNSITNIPYRLYFGDYGNDGIVINMRNMGDIAIKPYRDDYDFTLVEREMNEDGEMRLFDT